MGRLVSDLKADLAVLSKVRGKGAMAFVACFCLRAGYQAVVLYRFAAMFNRTWGVFGRVLSRLTYRLNIILNGCDIDPAAQIGPGFKLPHPVGVVIGPAVIGSHVMMLQNTTLGMRHFSDDEMATSSYPHVGDHVTICAGAVISGPVHIGRGATIGANAVVLQNIPADATAVGIPARVLFAKGSDQSLFDLRDQPNMA